MSFDQAFWATIRAAAALVLAGLAGCATPPSDPVARAEFERTNDPLEPLNRKTFSLNQFLDHNVFRPAAKAYVAAVPEDGRKAIHHVLDNMKEPTLFFNHMLQGEFKRAGITLGRFVVNSTVGFGGVVDVMTLSGVEREPADFGQTLFVWGVHSGPYLILPVVGPSNPRDAIGGAVDSYADPATILVNSDSINDLLPYRFLIGGLDERAEALDVLDDLERNSVDFYAELRSLSQQHREGELRHGVAPNAAPGLYDDPGRTVPVKPGAAVTPAVQTPTAMLMPAPAMPAAAKRPAAPPHSTAAVAAKAACAKSVVSRCAARRSAVRATAPDRRHLVLATRP